MFKKIETAKKTNYNKGNKKRPKPSISDYRELMNDQISTDNQIVERLVYFENLCRAIITSALQNKNPEP